jgi:hypothetical protein
MATPSAMGVYPPHLEYCAARNLSLIFIHFGVARGAMGIALRAICRVCASPKPQRDGLTKSIL